MGRRLASTGMLAGVAGSLLLAAGAVLLRELPSTDASALDVYTYFLDNRDTTLTGAVACIGGLALLVPFLTTIRPGAGDDAHGPARATMLAAGTLAIAAAAFAAAIVAALAVGAEGADAEGSRTALDVAVVLAGAAGPCFAIAILCSALIAHDGGAPAWVAILWSLCGLACVLWLGPVVSDVAALGLGSVLGTFAGLGGLIVWTATAATVAQQLRPRYSLPQ
jgi:hypothetical protein